MQTVAAEHSEPLRTTTTGRRVHFKSILTLAVVARLGVICFLLSKYSPHWFFQQALDLGFMAQSLNSGHGLSSPFGGWTGPTAFVAPGYPAIIALIFHLFGSYGRASEFVIMVLQMLFAVAALALMMHVAHRLFGAAVANLAGGFWAVSMPIFLPIIFWDTCLSVLFLIAMIALALTLAEGPSLKLWLASGAYCGIVLLVNPSLIVTMFAIFAWAACQRRPRSMHGPLLGLLVLLVVFAPWPIRNARVMHAFIPLRSNFGYELWQGNRPGGDGIFHDAFYPLKNKAEYADYASRGEIAYMHEKSDLAKSYIRAKPEEFLKLCIARVARFWTGSGSPGNAGLMEAYICITSFLGLAGLILLFRMRRSTAIFFSLPIALFPLPYYITHPDFRFRMLLDPLLTILAAYAVIEFDSYLRSRRNRTV